MNKEQEEGKGMRRRWGRGGGAEISVIKEISYLLFAQGIRGEDCVFAGSGGRRFGELGLERGMHIPGPLSRPLGGLSGRPRDSSREARAAEGKPLQEHSTDPEPAAAEDEGFAPHPTN